MRAVVLIDNGYEELETMGPIALLRRGGVDVDIVRLEKEDVTGRFGVQYTPTIPYEDYDFEKADCLVIPGGPQHMTMRKDERVLKLLPFFAQEKILGAICAAPTILGQEGLLKGKNYTCFESLNDDFGGIYHRQYVVRDGNLITACSAAASVEFGFALLEALIGKTHADQVKESVYYGFDH
ncbi:MAG: DJ-1/PfpI family protein [Absicoccus sp.]|uniref:DJ-1/PfpI family protein n=1 Tax=Absicoccus intestinalis TaxID=2926319 RepID=A0ABU4WLK9_9FIRM|nr:MULTISPECIES: DJ-1/PfpI family protein [unclassified Absicoccus]MDX8416294.1 DJ-1/PfpI family protein [Absicoccus sp. CLA-KB-P134]MDY3035861.1 DJ-1/PfpI family protein [Absicoccus sp.]